MDFLMNKEIVLGLLYMTAIYFVAVNFFYAFLAIISWLKIKQFKKQNLTLNASDLPSVSFLVPAYNEETLIVETIQTYLSLPQLNKEIIVVNDGSHDQTMKLLQVMFQLRRVQHQSGDFFESLTRPELKVIDATRMGKAEALNYGVRFTKYDLICTMDADTIPTAFGVESCLHAFKINKKLVAAGGVIQIIPGTDIKDNTPTKHRSSDWITSFQRIEYLRTFVCERLGWSFLGSTLLISGAFCMIKKEAIIKIGGFCPKSITEDFELIVRLRKFLKGTEHEFKIFPVTTCYTQAPRTLGHLSKQRVRWQLGLIQTLIQNTSLFFRPRHGILGLIAIPYFWIVEVLSPIMVFIGLILLTFSLSYGWVEIEQTIGYFSIGILFNLLITLLGIHFDEKHVTKNKSWPISRSFLETILIHFGYKQINAWWRLKALVKAFSKRQQWGEKPRREIIHRT